MSVSIHIKDRFKGFVAFANLGPEDRERVERALLQACMAILHRDYPQSSELLIVTSQKQPTRSDIQDLMDLAWDTFKIAYAEKQWPLSRCLATIGRVLMRRYDNRNWDFSKSEEKSMLALNEYESKYLESKETQQP
jgi:hypothetical protein